MDQAMGHAYICWGRYINGPIGGYYGDRIYLARNVVDNAGHSAFRCGEVRLSVFPVIYGLPVQTKLGKRIGVMTDYLSDCVR